MTKGQLGRRLRFIVADLHRLRVNKQYDAVIGTAGANEIVLAEALLDRACRRLRGEEVGRLPHTLREIRAGLEREDEDAAHASRA